MAIRSFPAALALAATLLLPAGATAGGDHDHGDAAPSAAGPARPRFAAVSETFELVGVLDGRQITLYLDRSADNTPVTEASIELEVAGTALKATPRGDAFEAVLAARPAPGIVPITATVTAGTETDLLAGELDLHDDAHAAAASPGSHGRRFAGGVAAALAALLALVAAGVVVARRVAAARRIRSGAAA
jgi:hypothetical protein